MTGQISAPWTPEQVDALNRFQTESGMHPFTCGNEHPAYDQVTLTAGSAGWHCDVIGCDYQQDWAHAFMADPDAWPAKRLGRTTPDNPVTSSGVADNSAQPQLTPAEAQAEIERLATELYNTQDTLAWVREQCALRDRQQNVDGGRGDVKTAEVLAWLEGPKCSRELAVERREPRP